MPFATLSIVEYDGNNTVLVVEPGLTCSMFIVGEDGNMIGSIEVPERGDSFNVSSLEKGEEFRVLGGLDGQEVVISKYIKRGG